MVVGKFCVGDFVSPRTRVTLTEDLKVCFNLLIDTFCFSVRLGVIGGEEGEVIVKEFSKLFDKGRGELWTMIRDYFVVESKAKVNLVEKKGGYFFGGNRFLGRAENYPFSKVMVDHNQQKIKARGSREINDKVIRDLLKEA